MAVRIPDGTRTEKINSKPGDTRTDGAQGLVLSRFPPDEYGLPGDALASGYFVEWDDLPGLPVFIAAVRIRPVTT